MYRRIYLDEIDVITCAHFNKDGNAMIGVSPKAAEMLDRYTDKYTESDFTKRIKHDGFINIRDDRDLSRIYVMDESMFAGMIFILQQATFNEELEYKMTIKDICQLVPDEVLSCTEFTEDARTLTKDTCRLFMLSDDIIIFNVNKGYRQIIKELKKVLRRGDTVRIFTLNKDAVAGSLYDDIKASTDEDLFKHIERG
jgi:hypothetical protein